MKIIVLLLLFIALSNLGYSSEITTFNELNQLNGRTIELKQNIKIGSFISKNEGSLNLDLGCQTDSASLDINKDFGKMIKKDSFLNVEAVVAESSFKSILDLEGPRQSSAYVKFKLNTHLSNGEEIQFFLRCWSGSGSKFSKKKVELDVVSLINNLISF